MEETFCTVCHGRGLDRNDHICHHCDGSGIEPMSIPESEQSGLATDPGQVRFKYFHSS